MQDMRVRYELEIARLLLAERKLRVVPLSSFEALHGHKSLLRFRVLPSGLESMKEPLLGQHVVGERERNLVQSCHQHSR